MSSLPLAMGSRHETQVGIILTLGGSEVDDISVLLEHVDLLDGLDGLDVHLLKGGLELLVIGTGGLVDLLDLAAGRTLASDGNRSSVLK